MVRRMWGNGLMVMVLAACVLLPGRVQGAEFDVSKFNQEVGLRFGVRQKHPEGLSPPLQLAAPLGHLSHGAGQKLGPLRSLVRGGRHRQHRRGRRGRL